MPVYKREFRVVARRRGGEETLTMKSFALLGAVMMTSLSAIAADPALTIYNQNFAVVRETVPLELRPGVNEVRFSRATAQAEAESVQLRDPSGRVALNILEQDYR